MLCMLSTISNMDTSWQIQQVCVYEKACKACAACRASSAMHDEVVQHVLRAPLAFFHTNPTGRILNRLSKDQGIADDHLPQVAFDATQSLFLVAGKLCCCHTQCQALGLWGIAFTAMFLQHCRNHISKFGHSV